MSKEKKLFLEIIGLICSLVILIPMYLLIINSFKDFKSVNTLSLSFPTTGLKQIVDNYTEVFKVSRLFTAYKSSIIITVFSDIIILTFASMTGFILQRRKEKFINFINFIIIAGMTLPFAIVPTFFIIKSMGLTGTYLSVILVFAATIFPSAVFLYTGYYNSIPVQIDESATIDGCGPLRLFFQIILPLLKPVTVTVLIINTVGIWNNFTIPMFMLNSPNKFTVVLTIYSFFGQKHSDWHLLFADIVLISAPIVVLYLAMQKYIVSGMTTGSVKG